MNKVALSMSIVEELTAMNAPNKVLDAGKEVEASIAIGSRPNSSIVAFIRQWVGRANSQDRYGK